MALNLNDQQKLAIAAPTSVIQNVNTPQSLSGLSIGNKTIQSGSTPAGIAGVSNPTYASQDTLVKTPTSVVSAKTAANTAAKVKQTVNTQNTTNSAKQHSTYDAADPNKLVNGKLLNPPGALYDRNTGSYIGPGTDPNLAATDTDPTQNKTVEDHMADETMHPGQVQMYNQKTGAQEWVAPNTPGYSSQNPQTRKDVSATANTGNGVQYKQFSDGSYGRYDAAGNFSPTTAQAFSDAKQQEGVKSKIDSILNGSFVLPQNQQAQLTGIQAKYADLIAKQETENANVTGATTIAENLYGLGNTLTGKGVITKAVNDGIAKVATLQASLANDLATMTSAFEKDDMAMLKDSWDSYQSNQADIQNEIDATAAKVQAEQDKLDAKYEAYALQQSAKYADAGILPTDTPQEVDRKKQENSQIYKQEASTKSGVVDQDVLDGMLKIYNKTGSIPAGMGNASVELKKAFYAAIGGDTNLTDDATANKAALGAATKALATQQNQYNATQTSIGTLKSSMNRVEGYLKPLADTGSPLLNKPLRALSGKVLGNKEYSGFQNEINTVANEYAKIISGASASIAGVSVQGVEDIKKALNDNVTAGQLETVLDAMRQDVNARLTTQKGVIDQVTRDIHDIGTTPTSNSSTDNTPTGDDIYNF